MEEDLFVKSFRESYAIFNIRKVLQVFKLMHT